MPKENRPAYHRWYKTKRWERRAANQLLKEPICRMCFELDGRVEPARVADHIEPHHGNELKFLGPLQSLCLSCHASLKAPMERGKKVFRIGVDGWPIEIKAPWDEANK